MSENKEVSAAAAPSPEVEAIVGPFIESGAVAGAVALVADVNNVLSINTFGYADIANKLPMQPNTVFWVASQTKPVTGALFMALVDEGKVSLDDTVETYLPEFKDLWVSVYQDDDNVLLKRPTRPITLRDTLCHVSGIQFMTPIETPTLDRLPLVSAVKSYAMTPLRTQPGTAYAYSNAGINTAARVIEVISGMPYEQYLDEKFLQPLEMTDTTFWPSTEQVSRIAKAYKPNAEGTQLEEILIDQLRYPLDGPGRYPMPAGGLFSTATDMAQFCQMVAGHGMYKGKRILSEESVKQMTSRQTPDTLDIGYGAGWSLGENTVGHGGALATGMNISTKTGRIAVWLVQHAGFLHDGGSAGGAFTAVIN